VIPIRDENPTRTTPYIVYLLIALNVFVYMVDQLGGHTVLAYNAMGQAVGRIPVDGLWNYTMVPAQIWQSNPDLPARIANVPQIGVVLVPHPSPSPVWLTIFTSMFLHGGLLHIGGNMLYLWIFGNNIEDVLGHFKFILFYLIGGVVAALAHILSSPSSAVPTLGASGAIAAVLGAYIILYPNARVMSLVFLGFFATMVAVPAVVVLGLWIFLQVISTALGGGMTPGGGVAYWAHIGGFAFGVVVILLLGGRRLIRGRREDRAFQHYWYEER